VSEILSELLLRWDRHLACQSVRILGNHYIPIVQDFVSLAFVYESRINRAAVANSCSVAELVAESMEFFVGATCVGPTNLHAQPHLHSGLAHALQNCLFALRAAGGFLPKKEPSAIFPEEIGHFPWLLL
jgi:hypothetical protein